MKLLWAVGMVLSISASAFARSGNDDESRKSASPSSDPLDRIQKLEREIELLKAELPRKMALEEQEKKEEPKAEAEIRASFTDGFHLKTTDGNFDLHIGGRWLEEYRYTFNRPVDGGAATLRTSTNSFYIREAFISLNGTLYKDWEFKFNGDFSPTTGALIEEAYVIWKPAKELKFFFGQFKGPISMETSDSPRFLETIQRSPMARFIPGMDLGVRVEGGLWDNLFYYQLAVTNGRSHTVNVGRNQIDDNDGKEYMGRLQVQPLIGDKDSILQGLRLGVYGSFSHIGQDGNINPTGWPGNLATNELAVTYLAFPAAPGFRFAGDRYRVGGEFTYYYGPCMLRGEVMGRSDEFSVTATGGEGLLRSRGYYAVGTVVLTGEKKTPNTRLVPLQPLNIKEGHWGALELVARFANVSLSRDELNDMAVDLAQNSNRVSEVTLGVNWWPTQNTRFSLDYVGENYHQGVQLSGTHHGSHLNGVLARFQVDF
jgi:phosphate-selective porin OprO/OprP